MPPVIPQHFLDAKKRMKMGLHPAVLAAVQRAVAGKGGQADPTTLPNDPASIRRFQQFHGIRPTGAVDAATQAQMQRVRTTLAPAVGATTGMVDLGTGVNPGHARAVPPGGDARAAIDPLANQRYHSFLQGNAATGDVREVHVYGTGANRQVRSFARKVTPQLQEQIGSTLRQQLSNSATAEDKMLALAHRAAAGQLAQRVGSKRRFSRNPGPMQRY
jgi:peptidoglycan hydrolase-like protein with peptidoglycan-binding domain